MAFSTTTFGPIGGQSRRGQSPQMFGYVTEDDAATIDGSGYFNDAATMLSVGDVILCVTTSTGTPTAAGLHTIVSNASGVVDADSL